MSVYYSLHEVPKHVQKGVITIGNFDGVHRGHQALIERLCEIKGRRQAGVLTFSPHPVEFFNAESKLFRLSSDTHKAKLLLSYGADFVVIHKLSAHFLRMNAKEFIARVLQDQLKCEDLIVGDDFCFGAQAQGRLADLAQAADAGVFRLHVIKGKTKDGERCSSSAIRNYLSHGNVRRAQALLGRPFSMQGQVSCGQGLAHTLGFATANIVPSPNCGLARGVYASLTRVNGVDYMSATNVGIRPSVSKVPTLVVETHLLDQNLDLYGQDIEIFFIEHIREELTFNSLEALTAQIQKDIESIRVLFKLGEHNKNRN